MKYRYNYFLDPPNMKDDSVIKEDSNSEPNKTETVIAGADTKQISDNLIMMSQETQWINIDFYSQELSNQSISSISISPQDL